MSAEQLQLDWTQATRARDEALERIGRVVDPSFTRDGERFVLAYLAAHGEVPGEDLTDAAERIGGIRPTDGRHWGSIFMRLKRRGLIEVCGSCKRRKGHASSGGNVYRLRQG